MDRWVYRIIFSEGNSGTCISRERIFKPLEYFRRKFSEHRVSDVDERSVDGRWVPSYLLPQCPEEAESIEEGPDGVA